MENEENNAENKEEKPSDSAQNFETDDQIFPKLIEEEMKQSYLDYAMSVIIGRALPDVRDGLKPVHRRILFSMNDMNLTHSKPYKKSARIVGECLGKYHPHGDSAVYDAQVRMAQPFSLRYPLIQGQGNFGSIDGDRAAAMRYTEARLEKISQELLTDLDKETVNFVDNFDGSLKEPSVLPSKIPNLLINGSSGIAVGMATNIPPHNVSETCDAVIKLIENPNLTTMEAVSLLPGPDFPTGGYIVGTMGIKNAYATGHGKLKVRAKIEYEEGKTKNKLVIYEIPYMVNKTALIEEIVSGVKNKVVVGISDIRDESDRSGMRIVLMLKKDANKDVTINQLHKHTRLQTTFSINLLALTNGYPKVMPLKETIVKFIEHRIEVIKRRTVYELKKAKEKLHILEGLIIALNNIDKAIAIIKQSSNAAAAREGLMSNFELSEKQSQAILDMKLQKLTSLETEKIRDEHKKLEELIVELESILASDERIMNIIKEDLEEVKNKYSDERRTEILDVEDEDIEYEDLIDKEDVVITISHSGYIKRTSLDLYKEQRRGGKGIIATTTKEEDIVEHLFIANTHDYILFFTDDGKVNWLKVYKIPDSGRYSKGKFIINLLDLPKERKITAYIKIKEFDEDHYLVMGTKNGVVKKTNLIAYSKPRAGGIRAITLDEGDELVNVMITDGEQHIMLVTKFGRAVKFKEQDARPIGRTSRGVRGVNLREGDNVVSMMIAKDDKTVLTITENGYGKRTKVTDYRLINRGGKGVINIICSERNGHVVDAKSVTDDDQIMFISKNGIMIRTPTGGISVIGRNTQGMRLMKMNEGDKVVAAAKVVTTVNDDELSDETEDNNENKDSDDVLDKKVENEVVKKDESGEEAIVPKVEEEETSLKNEDLDTTEKETDDVVEDKPTESQTKTTLDEDADVVETVKEAIVPKVEEDDEDLIDKEEESEKSDGPDEKKIKAAQEQLKSMGIEPTSRKEE
jgi:DNA gyrase subunit A